MTFLTSRSGGFVVADAALQWSKTEASKVIGFMAMDVPYLGEDIHLQPGRFLTGQRRRPSTHYCFRDRIASSIQEGGSGGKLERPGQSQHGEIIRPRDHGLR